MIMINYSSKFEMTKNNEWFRHFLNKNIRLLNCMSKPVPFSHREIQYKLRNMNYVIISWINKIIDANNLLLQNFNLS